MAKKKPESGEHVSPAERLNSLKALFERWVDEGLPDNVDLPLNRKNDAGTGSQPSSRVTLPTSLNQVMVWTAPEFGVHQALGSKRYVTLKDDDFGPTAEAILNAITTLKNAKKAKRPPPKTEKAKRVAAVGLAKKYMGLFIGVTKQLHEQGERLSVANRDLLVERNRVEMLEDDLAQAQKENASLKQMLARKKSTFHVVD